jgi:hypothetical protein
MRTEEVAREPRAPAQLVSRALQDLAPLAAEVIDKRDRRVPLSAAGYVLRAGHRYRLRLLLPDGDDLLGVKVLAPPDFLRVDPEVVAGDADGRRVHDIPFRVRRDLGVAVYRLGNVSCDELEVSLQFRPESGKYAPSYSYPVVVRPGLGLASLGALATLLSVFAPVLADRRLTGEREVGQDFLSQLGQWLADPRLWVCLAVIASLPLAVYGVSLWQLARRGRELRRDFEERYAAVADGRDNSASGRLESMHQRLTGLK